MAKVDYEKERENLKILVDLSVKFMKEACRTQDMRADSLPDFIGWCNSIIDLAEKSELK